jgi:hyperosmotically inducible protein
MKTTILALLLVLMSAGWQTAAAQGSTANDAARERGMMSPRGVERITKEVRHELLLLPYYGVFDFLAYKVGADGTVTLLGQAARPTLKSDAENAVKHIEGVEHVDNQIQVLPLSPSDDQIRRAAFRTIYGSPQLSKYSWEAVQSIHIIVNHGNITLEGVVDNQGDKQVAEIQAKGVANAFSVTNNLAVIDNK